MNSVHHHFTQLCKSRDGNDRYMERGMQTFNDDPKNKTIQTNKIVLQVKYMAMSTFMLCDA